MLTTVQKWFDLLELPREYKEVVENCVKDYSHSQIETEENPVARLNEQENKTLCLIYALNKCESFFNHHKELGIPENILFDTIKELKRHTKICTLPDGKESLGIFQIKWINNVLSGNLFCLGRLEFEMKSSKRAIEKYGICPDEKVIGVHIHGTKTPIDKQSVDASFDIAYRFFEKYFPDFDYKGFTCHSWLMDPTLRELLPPTSNIVGFLDRFDTVFSNESDSILKHIFDKNATFENADTYVAKTSLQKAVIDHIQKGGKLYMSLGYKQK